MALGGTSAAGTVKRTVDSLAKVKEDARKEGAQRLVGEQAGAGIDISMGWRLKKADNREHQARRQNCVANSGSHCESSMKILARPMGHRLSRKVFVCSVGFLRLHILAYRREHELCDKSPIIGQRSLSFRRVSVRAEWVVHLKRRT